MSAASPGATALAHAARALCVVALGATAGAAELLVRDVGIQLEMLPTDFSYELSDPDARRDGDDAFDSGYGLALGGAYSFVGPGRSHGPVAGLALTAASYAGPGDGSMTSYGLRLAGGWAWAFHDRWTASAMAQVGGGMASLDLPGGEEHPAFQADGIWLGYGVDLGVSFAVGDRWQLRLELGYASAEHALSDSGSDIDLTLGSAGLHAALGLTWRFSTVPWRLE